MNYKISKPFAMQSPIHPTLARLSALPVTALLTLTLSACAAGPGEPKKLQSATPVTHNCKPQETVGFSCELRDHRLLSLCASPGFEKFKGLPKDNPGYAYLAVGTQKGEVQYSYPPNPRDYKKHFFKGVPTNGIPYMFVASSKGKFFFLAEQDDTDPEGVGSLDPENLPDGWDIDTRGAPSPCLRLLNFENFSELGMTHETAWFKERDRLKAEKAKAKQP
ncbi:hypothetical protein [Hydrogenophaga sp. ZJX-1]|uniref:hypothetical protein n=1 Tax=Hydrogenophaga sp. ZJX-1 TaxID=3404778 RepID=UPI003B289C0E